MHLLLSTRSRYGLKMMFELALAYGNGPVSLKDIARKQKLSETYLEQLVAPLRKEGLVNSVRGAQGGYELKKEPNEISVGDIIRILEGSLAASDCVEDGNHECNRADCCATRRVWERITNSIYDVIDNTSLQNMINDYKDLNPKMTTELMNESIKVL